MDQACPYSPLCLGMCEFYCPGQSTKTPPSVTSPPTIQPLPQMTLAAVEPLLPSCNYELFSEFIGDKELAELSQGLIPSNTSKCTKWALKTFYLWKNTRNQGFSDDCIPEDLFYTVDPNTYLTYFAVQYQWRI